MKKRLRWRLSNLMGDTPGYITKLQMIWGSLTTVVAGSTWYGSNASYALIVGVVGLVVDKIIIGGLAYEEV